MCVLCGYIGNEQAAGRKLYPFEIKAARTYNKDFARSIGKFNRLNNKMADGCIIYAGKTERTVDHIALANFISTAEYIR